MAIMMKKLAKIGRSWLVAPAKVMNKAGYFPRQFRAPASGCRLSGTIQYQNGSHRHRDPDL
jgi:hypothetical protein